MTIFLAICVGIGGLLLGYALCGLLVPLVRRMGEDWSPKVSGFLLGALPRALCMIAVHLMLRARDVQDTNPVLWTLIGIAVVKDAARLMFTKATPVDTYALVGSATVAFNLAMA